MGFLTLENVSHHYFSKNSYTKSLNNISFSIKENEFIALLGPSGCGKSTVLSILAGIMDQTEGHVLINQKPIHQSDLTLGYMLQQDYLFPWKTIMENILIGPKLQKQNNKDIRKKAQTLLHEVGLENVEDAYPDSLSGGMRQRVALVRTLITEPTLLLLDEPFSALDYLTKLKLEDLVSSLLKTYKKTSILVTHDIAEAISMSDRILLMSANPGSIAGIFDIPIEIRNEVPFLVRRHPKYQIIFDKVWDAFNQINPSDNEQKGVSTNETNS